MTPSDIKWPKKTREYHDHHTDSTIWNDFKFRADDIIIATYAKSGTTWTQQIVSQLLHDGAEGIAAADMSPWVDMRVPPKEVKLPELEKQPPRRFLKTHLPADAIVYSPQAKYIFIARDGRDVAWSFYNHHKNANEAYYDAVNNSPGRVGPAFEPPKGDVVEYFREFVEKDGFPYWPFWQNIRTWWEIRDLPNLLTLHFADMKADLPGTIRQIAEFLEIPIKEEKWPAILEHCSFDYMKENAAATVPLNGALWEGGAKTFIHKGTNGRWADMLSQEDIKWYEAEVRKHLGDECAEWLAHGSRAGR